MWTPTFEDLTALQSKYAEIVALRKAHGRGEPIPDKPIFRSLAKRFPGALRELDTVPLDILETRLHELSLASAGGVIEPWMSWMIAYHAFMRAALSIKASVGKRGNDASAERLAMLARVAAVAAGMDVDESFVVEVLRLQTGRIGDVVMARLSAFFRAPTSDIQQVLFPGRLGPASRRFGQVSGA